MDRFTHSSPPALYGFYEKDCIIGTDVTDRETIARFISDKEGNVV